METNTVGGFFEENGENISDEDIEIIKIPNNTNEEERERTEDFHFLVTNNTNNEEDDKIDEKYLRKSRFENIQIIRKLAKHGMNNKEISSIIKIDEDEIEKIIKENNIEKTIKFLGGADDSFYSGVSSSEEETSEVDDEDSSSSEENEKEIKKRKDIIMKKKSTRVRATKKVGGINVINNHTNIQKPLPKIKQQQLVLPAFQQPQLPVVNKNNRNKMVKKLNQQKKNRPYKGVWSNYNSTFKANPKPQQQIKSNNNFKMTQNSLSSRSQSNMLNLTDTIMIDEESDDESFNIENKIKKNKHNLINEVKFDNKKIEFENMDLYKYQPVHAGYEDHVECYNAITAHTLYNKFSFEELQWNFLKIKQNEPYDVYAFKGKIKKEIYINSIFKKIFSLHEHLFDVFEKKSKSSSSTEEEATLNEKNTLSEGIVKQKYYKDDLLKFFKLKRNDVLNSLNFIKNLNNKFKIVLSKIPSLEVKKKKKIKVVFDILKDEKLRNEYFQKRKEYIKKEFEILTKEESKYKKRIEYLIKNLKKLIDLMLENMYPKVFEENSKNDILYDIVFEIDTKFWNFEKNTNGVETKKKYDIEFSRLHNYFKSTISEQINISNYVLIISNFNQEYFECYETEDNFEEYQAQIFHDKLLFIRLINEVLKHGILDYHISLFSHMNLEKEKQDKEKDLKNVENKNEIPKRIRERIEKVLKLRTDVRIICNKKKTDNDKEKYTFYCHSFLFYRSKNFKKLLDYSEVQNVEKKVFDFTNIQKYESVIPFLSKDPDFKINFDDIKFLLYFFYGFEDKLHKHFKKYLESIPYMIKLKNNERPFNILKIAVSFQLHSFIRYFKKIFFSILTTKTVFKFLSLASKDEKNKLFYIEYKILKNICFHYIEKNIGYLRYRSSLFSTFSKKIYLKLLKLFFKSKNGTQKKKKRGSKRVNRRNKIYHLKCIETLTIYQGFPTKIFYKHISLLLKNSIGQNFQLISKSNKSKVIIKTHKYLFLNVIFFEQIEKKIKYSVNRNKPAEFKFVKKINSPPKTEITNNFNNQFFINNDNINIVNCVSCKKPHSPFIVCEEAALKDRNFKPIKHKINVPILLNSEEYNQDNPFNFKYSSNVEKKEEKLVTFQVRTTHTSEFLDKSTKSGMDIVNRIVSDETNIKKIIHDLLKIPMNSKLNTVSCFLTSKTDFFKKTNISNLDSKVKDYKDLIKNNVYLDINYEYVYIKHEQADTHFTPMKFNFAIENNYFLPKFNEKDEKKVEETKELKEKREKEEKEKKEKEEKEKKEKEEKEKKEIEEKEKKEKERREKERKEEERKEKIRKEIAMIQREKRLLKSFGFSLSTYNFEKFQKIEFNKIEFSQFFKYTTFEDLLSFLYLGNIKTPINNNLLTSLQQDKIILERYFNLLVFISSNNFFKNSFKKQKIIKKKKVEEEEEEETKKGKKIEKKENEKQEEEKSNFLRKISKLCFKKLIKSKRYSMYVFKKLHESDENINSDQKFNFFYGKKKKEKIKLKTSFNTFVKNYEFSNVGKKVKEENHFKILLEEKDRKERKDKEFKSILEKNLAKKINIEDTFKFEEKGKLVKKKDRMKKRMVDFIVKSLIRRKKDRKKVLIKVVTLPKTGSNDIKLINDNIKILKVIIKENKTIGYLLDKLAIKEDWTKEKRSSCEIFLKGVLIDEKEIIENIILEENDYFKIKFELPYVKINDKKIEKKDIFYFKLKNNFEINGKKPKKEEEKK